MEAVRGKCGRNLPGTSGEVPKIRQNREGNFHEKSTEAGTAWYHRQPAPGS